MGFWVECKLSCFHGKNDLLALDDSFLGQNSWIACYTVQREREATASLSWFRQHRRKRKTCFSIPVFKPPGKQLYRLDSFTRIFSWGWERRTKQCFLSPPSKVSTTNQSQAPPEVHRGEPTNLLGLQEHGSGVTSRSVGTPKMAVMEDGSRAWKVAHPRLGGWSPFPVAVPASIF